MSIHDRDYMRAGPPPLGEWLRRRTVFDAVFALNVAVFFLQWIMHEAWLRDVLTGEVVRPLGGVSVGGLTAGHFWTPFTALFVHDGWGSFLGNILLLWYAGKRVQDLYGGRNFVLIYLLAGLVGAALELVLAAYVMKSTSTVVMGAAASGLGLLLAYAVAMPEEDFPLPLIRVSLRAGVRFLMGVSLLVGLITLLGHFSNWLPHGDMACFAHLGGGLAGWYYARSLGYGGVPVPLPPPRRSGTALRRRPELARSTSRARRPRPPVVDVDMEAVRRENPHNDPLVSLMKDEIDPILDKINDLGMGSLTNDERRALERASRRFSK